jgi:hypothetical protein
VVQSRRRYAGIEASVWFGLSLLYIPLTRSLQPSLLMTVLAVAILMGASKLLLVYGAFVWRRAAGGARLALAGSGALAAGTGAALLIRLLYDLLAPDVVPFSLAFNILSDVIWTGAHALAVGFLLRFLERRRSRSVR